MNVSLSFKEKKKKKRKKKGLNVGALISHLPPTPTSILP
jgi:hypothetical protein